MSIVEHLRRMDEKITSDIERTGLSIIGVGGGGPSFAYSIGLTHKFGFELLVVGLPMEYAMSMFNQIAAADAPPNLDVPLDEVANLPVMFKRCNVDLEDLHENYMVQADRFLRRKVDVVQMVLSDRQGRLPGDPLYDSAYMSRFQRLFFRSDSR